MQYYNAHFGYRKNAKCRQIHLKRLQAESPDPTTPKRPRETPPKATPQMAQRSLNFDANCQYFHQQQQQQPFDFPVPEDDGDEQPFFEVDHDEPPTVFEVDQPVFQPIFEVDQPNETQNSDPKSKIKENFADYVKDSLKNRSWLDTDLQAGIELMNLLHQNGAPLTLYDTIMEWHLAYLEATTRVTKGQLMERLRKRYHMDGCKPYITRVKLPSSGLKTRIPCHDASSMILDVLTDPRIGRDDYLWFSDNPLASPPAEWLELADINDALAYRKTYERIILPRPYTENGRRRVLLPVMLYMDGCVTGMNQNLSIEMMKFTLGIFNSKARDKDCAWRNLGAVPQYQHVKAKAVEMIEQSGHRDASGYLSLSESENEDTLNNRNFTGEFDVEQYINSSDDEEEMCNVAIPEEEAQNLHVILKVIMAGMKEIFQQGGFEWDYYDNGTVRRLQFIPFMLFVKGDTVEHDKHTGHYGARNRGIQCLCRYCDCPAAETDNPYADYPRKNPKTISDMIRKRDLEGLKRVSQKCIFNVWYEFGFGLHNTLGIHGASPMELLHWIQLGLYKYDREMFFQQTGKSSDLTRKINAIASKMGWLFQRQSDRAYPRTKFTKGIQKGTLMAHEMTGLILVLVAAIRSYEGRRALLNDGRGENSLNFPDNESIASWIMLLETQLQFENWLKKEKLAVSVVIRLRTKVRELMSLTKAVGRRTTGMAFKTNNFHATKHVPDDILMFGPPHCVNSRSNEMHHKKDKKSAKLTQKRPKTFDLQCAQRIEDRRVIEMGMEELKGKPRWDYFHGFDRPNQVKSNRMTVKSPKKSPESTVLTGVKSNFEYSEENGGGYVYKVSSSMKRKSRYRYKQYIVDAIADLAEELVEFVPELTVFSEATMPNGQIYRAAPFYQGKPWFDWAMCQVEEDIPGFTMPILPVQLRGFVDLRDLPENTTRFTPGLYFIGEAARLNTNMLELSLSEIMVPYLKENGHLDGVQLCVLPFERLKGPACVIPDVSHPSQRAYLRVRPMTEWAQLFENWVNSDHATAHPEPPIGG